jgi:hypothetical protein
MTEINRLLLELVEMAEAPLYSSYRWTADELGRAVPMSEFLDCVDDLLRQDALRLWSLDVKAREKSRLARLPTGLEQAYGRFEALDGSYDPLDLTLTLGPAANLDSPPPAWELDVDFEKGTFRLVAAPGTEDEAWEGIARTYPSAAFIEEGRAVRSTDRVEVWGSISARD